MLFFILSQVCSVIIILYIKKQSKGFIKSSSFTGVIFFEKLLKINTQIHLSSSVVVHFCL